MAAFQNGDSCPTKYLGYTIPANKSGKDYKYWNKKDQRVRSLDIAHEINKKLNDWQNTFDNYISECNLAGEAPNIEYLKSMLDGTYKTQEKISKKKTTLNSILQPFLDSCKGTLDRQTINKYKVAVDNLKAYQKHTGKQLLISDINKSFYKSYSHYLITEENNFNRVINRKQKQVVTFINFAIKELKIVVEGRDYADRHPLKEAPAAKFPLHPEELATLQAHKCKSDYEQMALDAFLVACETGLRYSDIIQLKPGHIKSYVSDQGLIRFIDLVNVKGSDGNNMPLSNVAAEILDRRMPADGKSNIFKFDYSQPMSRALKRILSDENVNLNRPCEIVQMQGTKTIREIVPLHDVISFHMARNTYITRLLSSGIAPAFVQHNAGHSKLDITMSYFRGDDVTRWQETLKILNSKN